MKTRGTLALLALLLGAGWAFGQCQETVIVDDDFTDDPVANGWVLNGNAWWDAAAEAIVLTDAVNDQQGSTFFIDPFPINNFRIEATVEICCGTGADGMTITLIGGENPALIGNGGGGMGATNLPGPQVIVEFDIYDNGAIDTIGGVLGGENHVGVEYSPTGFQVGDQLPSDAGAIPSFDLENAGPIDIIVQVQDGLVRVDLKRSSESSYKRIVTHEFLDWDEFDGLIGATASTGGSNMKQVVHRLKIVTLPETLCLIPPATATRTIESPLFRDRQGTLIPLFEEGTVMDVSIDVTDIRESIPPRCDVPEGLKITETPPQGWTISDVSDGGSVANGKITWILATAEEKTVTYRVTANVGGGESFSGEIIETGADCAEPAGIGGQSDVGDSPLTDMGFIRNWLILGPYTPGGEAPGVAAMQEDYLTDGAIDEWILGIIPGMEPYDGFQIETDFSIAYSTGLVATADPNLNPDGIPTWFEWYDLDDTIRFDDTFGGSLDNIMAYALAYVVNETGGPLDVDIGVGSDDSIQVWLNGLPIHTNSIARGSGGTNAVQDVIANQVLEAGINVVYVKVFEGGGDHEFRLRFQDAGGLPITDGLRIRLAPLGCFDPPLVATRKIEGGTTLPVDDIPSLTYEEGDVFTVTLDILAVRSASDECDPPAEVTIAEIAPDGWTISDASGGGTVAGGTVTWTLAGAAVQPTTLTYKLHAAGDDLSARIQSQIAETGSPRTFSARGDDRIYSRSLMTPDGFVRTWLLLGPFDNIGADNPGVDAMQIDYLTDGSIGEDTLEVDGRCWPLAGDEIDSLAGAVANLTGRNPDGIPLWFEWFDRDDTIDFTTAFGDLTNVMAYAACYVEAEADMDVELCLGSDDAIAVVINDEVDPPIWVNSIPRGWGNASECQDLVSGVFLHEGTNRILVKVFEGAGEHGFRLRIQEPGTMVPPAGIRVSAACGGGPIQRVKFLRGDVDANGLFTIGDAVNLLNHMFADAAAPPCPDAADYDDTGTFTIGDAISLLNFMFTSGPPPKDPGPYVCGPDPTDDQWPDSSCAYPASSCP
ncbi:MAG: hypothetical protein JXP34_20205 [Planctomycetes bacterium]|nr:hypothetical protein [Planctomycetota bacterium]